MSTEEQSIDGTNILESSEAQEHEQEPQDEELRLLLLPDVRNLPLTPPSAVESNFVTYYALDFLKPGHDQYVYRHANGLCVIGLAPSHIAFKDEGGITAVDFNVGKSDRSGVKVTGKRKNVYFLTHSLLPLFGGRLAIDNFVVNLYPLAIQRKQL